MLQRIEHLKVDAKISSDSELARKAGLNNNTLAGWAKQRRKRFPVADDVLKVARALGTSVEFLVTGESVRIDETDPDLEEILRMLRERPHDQLVELRGVIRSYVDTHFKEQQQTGT